ncbi:monofunctional biosynthetic peptidoglycan transglycosylase [Ferruginibacter sp. SUN002]|uniref:monofunctional biosynthetic peptidoglycan transglycosylase n=1 Tax=Ferruginibacter sp. SUN002 TaxID=2937789 RepID=UPI003D35B5E9
MKKSWPIIKKIFFWIFLAHLCWAVYFILKIQPFNDFDPKFFIKIGLILVIVPVVIVGLIYWFFKSTRAFINRSLSLIFNILSICYISSLLYFFLVTVVNPPITITQLGSLVTGNGLSRDYVSGNAMGSNSKLAVMASEDQLFPDHDGFDLKAIKLAMKYNKRHPNKTRGASTISQQVAKNVFLWQGGGFFRKGLEVYFTFMIESFWSKKKILQTYLNIAEMGRGIFGVQAAARSYFNKDAKDLTRSEAAMIAACLPNPKKYTVVPVSRYVASRYDDIMRQINNLEGDPDVQDLIR